MAIAYDAFSQGGVVGTFTHTPVGVPKGIFVVASHNNGVQRITGVTYGGVAMTRVRFDNRSSGAQSRSEIWFLGSGIPTGPQSVVTSGTSDSGYVGCISMTAVGNTAVVDNNGGSGSATATISFLLATGGATCMAIVAGAPHNTGAALSGETQLLAGGHTNGSDWYGYQTTPSATAFTAGCSQSASDYAVSVANAQDTAPVAVPRSQAVVI